MVIITSKVQLVFFLEENGATIVWTVHNGLWAIFEREEGDSWNRIEELRLQVESNDWITTEDIRPRDDRFAQRFRITLKNRN